MITAGKPVNLAQLDDELGGHRCLTAIERDGVVEISLTDDAPITEEDVAAAVDAHVAVFPPSTSLTEEFAAYRANVQAAIAQRDAVDADRDDWLLDLEFRLLDLEGA